jgi:hypothetical protein
MALAVVKVFKLLRDVMGTLYRRCAHPIRGKTFAPIRSVFACSVCAIERCCLYHMSSNNPGVAQLY